MCWKGGTGQTTVKQAKRGKDGVLRSRGEESKKGKEKEYAKMGRKGRCFVRKEGSTRWGGRRRNEEGKG